MDTTIKTAKIMKDLGSVVIFVADDASDLLVFPDTPHAGIPARKAGFILGGRHDLLAGDHDFSVAGNAPHLTVFFKHFGSDAAAMFAALVDIKNAGL